LTKPGPSPWLLSSRKRGTGEGDGEKCQKSINRLEPQRDRGHGDLCQRCRKGGAVAVSDGSISSAIGKPKRTPCWWVIKRFLSYSTHSKLKKYRENMGPGEGGIRRGVLETQGRLVGPNSEIEGPGEDWDGGPGALGRLPTAQRFTRKNER